MPIEPVDPSKKSSGDGTEKYTPTEKRGPGKFDDVLEKAKTDRGIEKEQIRKMGDALDRAGVPLPKRDSFPKTTAAFEEIARSDAERAERKAEKARAELSRIAEQVKSAPKYTGKAYSDTGPKTGPTSGGFGGGGGGAGIPKVGPKKPTDMKKGGVVKSASSRADGCAIRGKTRA